MKHGRVPLMLIDDFPAGFILGLTVGWLIGIGLRVARES